MSLLAGIGIGAKIAQAAKGFLSGQVGEWRKNVQEWKDKRDAKKIAKAQEVVSSAKAAGDFGSGIISGGVSAAASMAARAAAGTGEPVSGSAAAMSSKGSFTDKIGGWLKGKTMGLPNWILAVAGVLLLTGGLDGITNIFKPKRKTVRRRRPAAPKTRTVYKYRTSKRAGRPRSRRR